MDRVFEPYIRKLSFLGNFYRFDNTFVDRINDIDERQFPYSFFLPFMLDITRDFTRVEYKRNTLQIHPGLSINTESWSKELEIYLSIELFPKQVITISLNLGNGNLATRTRQDSDCTFLDALRLSLSLERDYNIHQGPIAFEFLDYDEINATLYLSVTLRYYH